MRSLQPKALAILAICALVLLAAAGCSPGAKAGTRGYVTIEPLASATPSVAASIGGKPAATSVVGAAAAATETPPAEPTSAVSGATDVPAAPATATAEPVTMDGSTSPTSGRWIDVNVTTYSVRLMDGTSVLREIGPVGVGAQVDTGAYESTQTGLFHVYNKNETLVYDPPYDTYISHWVGFDADRANGFHSFLKDQSGKVVDARTGRLSNGCIRTGEPEAVFAFAEAGMPVWVHH